MRPYGDRRVEDMLLDHLVNPVRFSETIANMADQVDIFIEVGPSGVLSKIASKITNKPVLSMDSDIHGMQKLAEVLSKLFTLGVDVDFSRWFSHRGYDKETFESWINTVMERRNPSKTTWRLKPVKAEPWHKQTNAKSNTKPRNIADSPITKNQKPVLTPSSHNPDERSNPKNSSWPLANLIDLQRNQLALIHRFLDAKQSGLNNIKQEANDQLDIIDDTIDDLNDIRKNIKISKEEPQSIINQARDAIKGVVLPKKEEILKQRADANGLIKKAPDIVGDTKRYVVGTSAIHLKTDEWSAKAGELIFKSGDEVLLLGNHPLLSSIEAMLAIHGVKPVRLSRNPSGVIHAASLDETDVTMSFFKAMKSLESMPEVLINITFMGGHFGLEHVKSYPAEHAGVHGILKSLAREYRHCRVQCLDMDPDLDSTQMASFLHQAIGMENPPIETGFNAQGIYTIKTNR